MGGVRGTVIAVTAALLTGCAPLSLSQSYTTSTPRPQSGDVADLAHEPVATLGLLAPASLQGLSPVLSHALVAAVAKADSPIRMSPAHETANRLNEQGLAAAYAEMIAGFARSGILDREQLRKIGSALGSRYVFLPGIAELNEVLADRFEAVGLKVVRNRVVTLRLWLQLWDAQSGRILWESAGETTVATQILATAQTTPLDTIAQSLWLRMLQDNLIAREPDRETPSASGTSGNAPRRRE
jgi:hypothetical protein